MWSQPRRILSNFNNHPEMMPLQRFMTFKSHFYAWEENMTLLWIVLPLLSVLSVKHREMNVCQSPISKMMNVKYCTIQRWEHICSLHCEYPHKPSEDRSYRERTDNRRRTDIYCPTCDWYMDEQDICYKLWQAESVRDAESTPDWGDGNRKAISGLIKLEESQKHHKNSHNTTSLRIHGNMNADSLQMTWLNQW